MQRYEKYCDCGGEIMFSRNENRILTVLMLITFGWLAYDIQSLRISDIMLIIAGILLVKTVISFFTIKDAR